MPVPQTQPPLPWPRRPLAAAGLALLLAAGGLGSEGAVAAAAPCAQPVYLTIDPGGMDYAPRIADILRRQQVPVTFWVSNQRTQNGEGSLGNQWGGWWKLVAEQGHEFASQTYDLAQWRGDLPGYKPSFRVRLGSGAMAGREFTYDPARYCEQITHAAQRIQDFTGRSALPLFRAPGGTTSPKLLGVAASCGYQHVVPASAPKLDRAPPLKNALAAVRTGDVLMLDLARTGAAEPWALGQLEPLILGLRERGLCFASLRQHPALRDWISSHGG